MKKFATYLIMISRKGWVYWKRFIVTSVNPWRHAFYVRELNQSDHVVEKPVQNWNVIHQSNGIQFHPVYAEYVAQWIRLIRYFESPEQFFISFNSEF